MRGVLVTAAFGLVALASVGCSTKDSSPANTGGPGGPRMAMGTSQVEPGPYYEGRVVFAKDCARCHSINGQRMRGNRGGGRRGPSLPSGGFTVTRSDGGTGMSPMMGGMRGGRRGGGGGPDLGKVGSRHPRDWIVSHVRNAKQDKPESRMPPFGEDKINKKDMDALADYLVSLKGKKSKKKKTESNPPAANAEEHTQTK